MLTPPLHLLDPSARPVVEAYLGALESGLPCGRTARRMIVAEVGDGLVDAVRAHAKGGLPPAVAAQAAVAAFGDPRRLAGAFARELVATAATRTGIALVTSGPAVGAVWVAAFAARSGTSWFAQLSAVWSAIPTYPLILAVTVPAAIVAAVAGSGRLPAPALIGTRAAAVAALVATGGCVVGDATLFVGLVSSGGSGWPVLVWLACAASMVRLSVAAAAGRRCARLHAAAVL
jgi:hypothetical protein